MNYYFKTTGIYNIADTICVRIFYRKGKGYEAVADACHTDENSVGKVFDTDYYKYYNDLTMMLFPCGRRSGKQLSNAEKWLSFGNNAEDFAKKWIEYAVNRGGRSDIKIIGKEIV